MLCFSGRSGRRARFLPSALAKNRDETQKTAKNPTRWLTRRRKRHLRIACLHEAVRRSFQHDSRENPGHIGASIHTDPVRFDDNFLARRMPMHDDLAEHPAGIDKALADPEKVFLDLTMERHARPHPRMNKEIASEFGRKF